MGLQIVPIDAENLSTPYRLGRRRLTFSEAIVLSNEVAALLGQDLAAMLQSPKSVTFALAEKLSATDWTSWIDFVFQARRPSAVTGGSGSPVLYYSAGTAAGGGAVWAPVTENLYDTVFPDAFDALVVVIRAVVGAVGPFDKYARFLAGSGPKGPEATPLPTP